MSEFKDAIQEVVEKLNSATANAEAAKSSAEEAQGYAESANSEAYDAEAEIDEALEALRTILDDELPAVELSEDQKEEIYKQVCEAAEAELSAIRGTIRDAIRIAISELEL